MFYTSTYAVHMVSLPTSLPPLPILYSPQLSLVPSCLFILWPPPWLTGIRAGYLSLAGSAETKPYFLTFVGFTFLITFPSWKGNTFTYSLSLGGIFKPSSYIFFYWRLLRRIKREWLVIVSFLLGMELQVHISLCAQCQRGYTILLYSGIQLITFL